MVWCVYVSSLTPSTDFPQRVCCYSRKAREVEADFALYEVTFIGFAGMLTDLFACKHYMFQCDSAGCITARFVRDRPDPP